MFIALFTLLQSVLALFMALHDWIDIPPFTNIKALHKAHSFKGLVISTIINTGTVLWGLLLTLQYYPGPYPFSTKVGLVIIYSLLTFGTLASWWIPYIFGSSEKHKAGFA